MVYTDQEGNYGKKADYQRCAKEIERNIKANDVSYVARAIEAFMRIRHIRCLCLIVEKRSVQSKIF